MIRASAKIKATKLWQGSRLGLMDHQGILSIRALEDKLKQLTAMTKRRPEEEEFLPILIEEINGHRDAARYDEHTQRS